MIPLGNTVKTIGTLRLVRYEGDGRTYVLGGEDTLFESFARQEDAEEYAKYLEAR